MGKISTAGIWVDCKQLLKETDRLVNQLSSKDNERYGIALIRSNLAMISNFSFAYNRKDQTLEYDNGEDLYKVTIKGVKTKYVDAVIAELENYKAIWELVDENIDMPRTSDEVKAQTHRLILDKLAKIENGLLKWRNSLVLEEIVVEKLPSRKKNACGN